MTPISDHCPLVVITAGDTMVHGASTLTGTAYLRVGDPGQPGGVALVLVDVEAVEHLANALLSLGSQMRALPTSEPAPARPALRSVTG